MSESILPLRQWPAGIPQASVPANDNALRLEALSRPCRGIENDVSTPADGDVYLVGSTPTGDFASFDENDIALARVDDLDNVSWYAWAPVDGVRVTMEDGSRKVFVGESTNAWQDESGGGGTVPPGGTTGQVLRKIDGTDYNTEWGSAGGSTLQDVEAPSNASGTVTLDFDGASRYVGAITLGANVTTLAFANLPGSGKFAEYEFHITQDPTTPRTFAIPASHKALGGSDTAISSVAGTVTVLTASTVDNGTTWRYAMQESA